MIELSQPEIARLRAADVAVAGSCRGEDATWLAVMVGVTALEASWWGVTWLMGIAPAPYLFTYLALSFAGLACALILRFALEPRAEISKWSTIVPATFSIGIGASLFLPLKYAIPKLTPFWLDQPLAHAERAIFAGDPWLLLDRFFGWAAVPMDRLYGLWLPTQALVLFLVISQPGSAAKSRALVAYVLAWFLLGVAAAALLSSAGPIFYDRLFGGTEFVALRESLQHRGAWVVLAESDRMWASLASGRPGIVAGISAAPSIHVAISVWMILVAKSMARRGTYCAVIYAAAIWIGSVQLGWHYVTDGLMGGAGMLAIWQLSRSIMAMLRPAA